MAKRAEIVAYLDELLDIRSFGDMQPNGLQVPGAEEVTRVVTGVSAQRELFERAAASGAELVLAHHGLFWDFAPRTIGPAMKQRLRILFDNDISLAAYTCRSTPTPRSATTR
jgi:putative NIF3 family GTP cyclohydrolase 1 type 2